MREWSKGGHGLARRGSSSLWVAWAVLLAACAVTPRVSVQSAVNSLPAPLMLMQHDDSTRRIDSFGALHETARLLIIAHGMQGEWARRGVVALPLESCVAAVSARSGEAVECTLIALADARTAVLVMSQSADCDRATCLEQSWVFLDDQRSAVPLPPRRAADYGSLRADLSREYAEALWLAGYRGRRDSRRADASDPYEDPDQALVEARGSAREQDEERPAIASYASCVRAPRSNELVCRSREGHLIGLNPLTSVERVIARLELDAGSGALDPAALGAPAFFTPEGKLAVAVPVNGHALCGGGACTLIGIVEQGQSLHLTPAPRSASMP